MTLIEGTVIEVEDNGKDPVVDRLDLIVEILMTQQEILEEMNERLVELELTAIGNGIDRIDRYDS